ncbi:MAG: type II toxin-antitoxin system PemK/MazF family toxin [Propionibacteriaceae bacterium]|jgi:hypothetical protein|nr:type II toxin-antitoxin system PemK/MazF family toxin [Propionibacteriaceae bacterium]
MSSSVENYSVALAWVQARGTRAGKKRRPVYILTSDTATVTFLIITTQYATKSPFIQQFYCPIVDWAEAHLERPSWINTFEINQASLREIAVDVIGFLSEQDTDRLFHMMSEHDTLHNNHLTGETDQR